MTQSIKEAAKHIIDWAFVFANANPTMKKQVMDTMARHDELKRLIQEAKASRPVLKWDHYANALRPTDLSLLESTKKSVSEFKPKPLNQTQLMTEIDQEEKSLVRELHEPLVWAILFFAARIFTVVVLFLSTAISSRKKQTSLKRSWRQTWPKSKANCPFSSHLDPLIR